MVDFNRRTLHKRLMGWYLREAEWLTAARAKAYLWILAVLNLVTVAGLVVSARGGVDRNGFLLGTDFLSFWTTGRMLGTGANPYDQAAHIAAQRAYFVQADAFTAFFYPPSFLPLCRPMAWLGYFPALAVWLMMTATLFAVAVKAWLRAYPLPVRGWLLLAAYPACVIEVTHGQTAFLSAGLLMLGMLQVRERPVLAGVLLGLATVKPQFGVLVPLVLVLTGEWRVILSAIITATGLAGVSALAFGVEVWANWAALVHAAQRAMAAGSVGYAKMVSPFAGAMLLGMPAWGSYIVQGAVAAAVVAMLVPASRCRGYTPQLGALTLVGAVLVTPFVLDYDLLLLAPALIVLTCTGRRHGFLEWERVAVFLAFAVAAFARPIGMNLHVPLVPPVAGLLFWVLWRRVRHPAPPNERTHHA